MFSILCHVLKIFTFKSKNVFLTLTSRMYIKRGCCRKPLPPTISQSSSGEVEFTKTPNTACGSVGIFTYELLNTSTKDTTEQIAVLFKVPFDLNLKSNEFAVGVFDISRNCNHGLFQDMSKNKGNAFVRGKAKGSALTHKGQDFTVMATMSDCYTPVIRVQVMDAWETLLINCMISCLNLYIF